MNQPTMNRPPLLESVEERPDYKRAAQIIVYSMQGGPIPEKAVNKLKLVAREVAEAYNGLAITIVEE